MNYLVGLTGGIGSGKSTVAGIFARYGIPVIDTDTISHQLTQSGGAAIPAIRAKFGDKSISSDGALDRNHMRKLVFSDSEAKNQLETILHPLILKEAQHQALTQTAPYVIVVVPLLFESGQYQNWLNRTLLVDCPEEVQISRAAARPGLSPETVRSIMRTQFSRKQRLQQADDVIDNGGTLDSLLPQIASHHQKYLRESAHAN